MTTQEKYERLKEFKNEKEFREFLIDFLKKWGFTNVIHTHRYGSPEQGKDIIAKYSHPIEGDDWYAFVVKLGRIGGGTNEVETIKNQIKQSFEYPYNGPEGEALKINKVKVVTNENFTGGAQTQISQSPELKVYNNFGFWWNEELVPKIDEYYSDYWLPGDAFAKEYSGNFSRAINNEIEIRELSVRRIDDKKIQRLLDIFVEPRLSVSVVDENSETKEKSLKRRNIQIRSITKIEENIMLSGEQGSGKSKVMNSIACNLASAEIITNERSMPVRLKAPSLRNNNFDIETTVKDVVKSLTPYFYTELTLQEYKPILFIDDTDLLRKDEKELLFENVRQYCLDHNTYYVLTYRKQEFDYDKGIKTIRIHNFNVRQIEDFVLKYFDGTDRGEKFIQILRDSDILAKLPTTPLTITLISLLYDENNFEIPATLSDIYTDFVSVLLGKLEITNKTDILLFNIKRRLFSALSLKMLDEKKFTISFVEFADFINNFLSARGYQIQSNDELQDIIEKSGILYRDENDVIGFKHQAFIEFLASIEIYDHQREEHYPKLIANFNDVNWQNTAIFYAGKSKELPQMIVDVISKAPNNDLKDNLITTGGMGYLAQALYLSLPADRKKLVFKAADNLLIAFQDMKKLSEEEDSIFADMPLPLILHIACYWFTENFKSVTLKSTLITAFNEIAAASDPKKTEFDNNFKLLLIASTMMHPYIHDDSLFLQLMTREGFMNHAVLPLVADMNLELGHGNGKDKNKDIKDKVVKAIRKKRDYIKAVLKEPAYRFNDQFGLEDK